jgi:hypothetical protein
VASASNGVGSRVFVATGSVAALWSVASIVVVCPATSVVSCVNATYPGAVAETVASPGAVRNGFDGCSGALASFARTLIVAFGTSQRTTSVATCDSISAIVLSRFGTFARSSGGAVAANFSSASSAAG